MDRTIDISGTAFGEAYNKAKENLASQGFVSPDAKEVGSAIKEMDLLPKAPVGVISTEQGKDYLTQADKEHALDLDRMNVEVKNREINRENTQKKMEAGARKRGGLSADEITSLGGNIADYNFIEGAGLYVPKTSETAEDRFQKDIDEAERTFNEAARYIDQTTTNLMSSITELFHQRKTEQQKLNEKNLRGNVNRSLANNSARYLQDSTNNLLTKVEQAGLDKIRDLTVKEASALAEADQARRDKMYDLFVKKRYDIKEIRKERQKTLDEIQKEATKQNKEMRAKAIQSTRDSAIAGIIQQGITDPATIIDLLNFDEAGNQIGDFTADEVEKSLKALAPQGDLNKLTGETRNFFVLKGLNQLPQDIASLPEEEQLMAWLNKNKSTSTTRTGDKITYNEAVTRGLPLSTVGLTEQDMIDDLYGAEPPAWFIEKFQNENPGISPDPEAITATWEEYRQKLLEAKDAGYRKPTAKVIGDVRALRAKGANPEEINNFILYSGYSPEDQAFE